MKKYDRYQLSLIEDNENSMGFNIYPPFYYDNNMGPIRVIGSSDSDGTITFSRQNGIAKLVVDGESISFNEKLWYKVVETMLSLNLGILNSNHQQNEQYSRICIYKKRRHYVHWSTKTN